MGLIHFCYLYYDIYIFVFKCLVLFCLSVHSSDFLFSNVVGPFKTTFFLFLRPICVRPIGPVMPFGFLFHSGGIHQQTLDSIYLCHVVVVRAGKLQYVAGLLIAGGMDVIYTWIL